MYVKNFHDTKTLTEVKWVSILVLLDVCKEQYNPSAVPTPLK